jgi:histidyl-tRNA synthetase
LGGGRYDHLVKQLGGPDRAGIGFAAGLERLVLAMPEAVATTNALDAFIVAIGDDARTPAQVLARDLRHAGLSVLIDHGARSAKAQMKKADRAAASYVLLLGEDEIARDEVTVKNMATGEQRAVARTAVAEQLGAGS